LPEGEQILWQGSPSAPALARSAFHVRILGSYFAILLGLRGFNAWSDSGSIAHALISMLWLLPLALAVVALLYVMAWLTAKTTVYTITTRRVVLHIGVVLDLTLNLPYERLESVALRLKKDGTGDLPIRIMAPNKIAFAHLWPHARPWHLSQPEPMLRSIADAERVGQLLAAAMSQVVDGTLAKPAAVAAKPKEVMLNHDRPLAAA
jgi:hypothetical protein